MHSESQLYLIINRLKYLEILNEAKKQQHQVCNILDKKMTHLFENKPVCKPMTHVHDNA